MKRDSAPAFSWSTLGLPDTLARLRVDASQGLTATDAAARLQRYGPNELRKRVGAGGWLTVRQQFAGLLPLILLGAAVLALSIGDLRSAGAIVAVVLLNALLGFGQEAGGGGMAAVLRQATAFDVRTRREGQELLLAASQLVPGDIVFLEAGRPVPADGRLLEVVNLRIQEAILTGDETPGEKVTAAVPGPDAPLEYQRNMAFLGTTVTHGRGLMVVTETGMRTQLGRVIGMIGGIEPPTPPLSRWLSRRGREAALGAGLLSAIAVGLGVWQRASPAWMAEAVISTVVAVVPVCLPLAVTLALAIGGRRMRKRRALLRRLAAGATAGAVTTACIDKVGVLTENRLAFAALDLAGHRVDLVETYHHREPVILSGESDPLAGDEGGALRLLLGACALCNDAELRPDPGRPGHFHALGDPTEGAQVVAAARCGLWKAELDAAYPRVAALPLDASRERMTTLHRVSADVAADAPLAAFFRSHYPLLPLSWVSLTRGTVADLGELIQSVWVDGHAEPLDDAWRSRLTAAVELVGQGMRIYAVGFRAFAPDLADDPDAISPPPVGPALEQGLTLLGLIGIGDPPRPETVPAVMACRAAGIRPVLLTADRPDVARQVARELGFDPTGRVLTGREATAMRPEALQRAVEDVTVFAGVSAAHKLSIVRALQHSGHIVALTGAGADDGPALAAADVGAATGGAGAGVAQDAAAIVLLDDSFATVLAAIEEGRGVWASIRQIVGFALGGAIGRALILLFAPLLGFPLAFTPLQLLYMGLVSDGLLGAGLSGAAGAPEALRRPPPARDEPLFGRSLGLPLLGGGALIGAIGLSLGLVAGTQEMHELRWDTLLTTTVIWAQAFRALSLRARPGAGLVAGLRASPWLLAAALLTVGLHLVALYAPALRGALGFTPLSAGELIAAIGAGSFALWAGVLVGRLDRWRGSRSRADAR